MSRDIRAEVPGWTPPPLPSGDVLAGRYARVVPLDVAAHTGPLWEVYAAAPATLWTYLPYGPFAEVAAFEGWLAALAESYRNTWFHVIEDCGSARVGGMASFLRADPAAGSIEVGHINLAPALQRTRAATEAMALMMGWAFGAGYRRYEWKCDAANLGSRRAAQRLGFSFEGVFRQAGVVKGRNRDTAWFACIDAEWPAMQAAFETWLEPANFVPKGRQRAALSDLTRPIRVAEDPALTGTDGAGPV